MIHLLNLLFLLFCSFSMGQEIKASQGISDLGWKLVQSSGNRNSVNSPLSIWLALAMTHAGARGQTASQLAEVLGLTNSRDSIASEAALIQKQLNEAFSGEVKLRMANKIFPQTGKAFLPDFLTLLEKYYQSIPEALDFSKDTESNRKKINQWVSENTEGKIPELIKAGVIDSLTRMVLTNAIYFKAPWAEPFKESATLNSPFYLNSKESVSVPFMNRKGEYAAGEMGTGENASVVCELPYQDQRFSMLLIIPKKIEGANRVLKNLIKNFSVRKLLDNGTLKPKEVELSLPKWTIRKPVELGNFLTSIGMTHAFKPDLADFSAMDGKKDLYISKVVHEGFVEVAEAGTEAAAATGVVMTLRGLPPPSKPAIRIRADRPFLWTIFERSSGVVVFSGRVVNPK
jgi:serpin B